MYKRPYYKDILIRLQEPRRFIQVVFGPRQVGKTFLIRQVIDELSLPSHYVLADEPSIRDRIWITQQWERARILAKEHGLALIVLDEIQKIEGWSETVKYLWDSDTNEGVKLSAAILGSSPMLLQRGLSESLSGRFEINHLPHWSYSEIKEAFGLNLEKFIYFGGYPGATELTNDENRWRRYVQDSLVETTVSKDILLMKRVDKPALLKRLFHLGCEYSGQILSYQKMLGQLQDAGNTTTLAHYLELLSSAGMLTGIEKYAGNKVRSRGSSPKFQVYNNALMTVSSDYSFEATQKNPDYWGRLVESAVGAHLINMLPAGSVYYWRERGQEVDFVIKSQRKIVAVEVKSGRRKENLSGMNIFAKNFKPDKLLLIGGDGIPIEEFLGKSPENYLR